MELIIQIFVFAANIIITILSILLFVRLQWPAPALWMIKLFVSAVSPLFVIAGIAGITASVINFSIVNGIISTYNTLFFSIYIYRVTSTSDFSIDLKKIFGTKWIQQINNAQKKYFLPHRFAILLPSVPTPRVVHNISIATFPDTNQKLLCDLWHPPSQIAPSGLAFIYFHGGAWTLLDKDIGTRPFFSHLAAQGHYVMDVAYRLAPEVKMMEMVHDIKRAIAWMKANAASYGVRPDKIVIGGGSSGGHLALLAAYSEHNKLFLPTELEGKDLSICGVISLYGPTDLEATYYHTNQHITTRDRPDKPKKVVNDQLPPWIIKKMGQNYFRFHMEKGFVKAGALAFLLGGHPDECPYTYKLHSPITHVHSDCPPTLLIHGAHDTMAPVNSTRKLYMRLIEENVPVAMHILPQSDHAFDLVLPKISPSAHSAIYDVERFLALLMTDENIKTRK